MQVKQTPNILRSFKGWPVVLAFLCLLATSSGCLFGSDCREDKDCKPGLFCDAGLCLPPSGDLLVFALLQLSSPITKVELSIQGTSHKLKKVISLNSQGEGWHGFAKKLPAAKGYTFVLKAYGLGEQLILSRERTHLRIWRQQTALLSFFSKEKKEATHTPMVRGIWASDIQVRPKESLFLKVYTEPAHQQKFTYFWNAAKGNFTPADHPKTVWVAPEKPGAYELFVSVRGPEGGARTLSSLVFVNAKPVPADTLPLRFNMAPVYVSLDASANSVKKGGKITLTLTAVDFEGNLLRYRWDDGGCGGLFQPIDQARTTWTAPTAIPNSKKCRLVAFIFDGVGGSSTSEKQIKITE